MNTVKKLIKKVAAKSKFGGRILVSGLSQKAFLELEAEFQKIENYNVVSIKTRSDISIAIMARNTGEENLIFLAISSVNPTAQLTTTCSVFEV